MAEAGSGMDRRTEMKKCSFVAVVIAVATIGSGATVAMAQTASSHVSKLLEQQEQMDEALREHCSGLQYRRNNAAMVGAWRDLVNMSKSYADGCAQVDDRYAIAKAYEDMALALMNLNDPRQALRWAQACLDGNGMAVGCAARKADILWQEGKAWDARSTIAKGITAGERAVGQTKVEMEKVRMQKPDPRSEQIFRTRYLRRMEQLETRLAQLEASLRLIKDMQDGLDAASGDNSGPRQ